MTNIKLYGVKWDVTTAGPSPDGNRRNEIFFFGCNRAVEGNPCKGCFNHQLWDNSVATITHSPEDMVVQILKHSSNKYVTIGGGEPTDQLEGLLELTLQLKEQGMHIAMYTWRKLEDIINGVYGESFKETFMSIMKNIDILIDGEFKIEEKLLNDHIEDGFMNSIGSGNQIIWDIKQFNETNYLMGYPMRSLDGLFLKDNDELVYILKDINTKEVSFSL